jgi:hypothetical protein
MTRWSRSGRIREKGIKRKPFNPVYTVIEGLVIDDQERTGDRLDQ